MASRYPETVSRRQPVPGAMQRLPGQPGRPASSAPMWRRKRRREPSFVGTALAETPLRVVAMLLLVGAADGWTECQTEHSGDCDTYSESDCTGTGSYTVDLRFGTGSSWDTHTDMSPGSYLCGHQGNYGSAIFTEPDGTNGQVRRPPTRRSSALKPAPLSAARAVPGSKKSASARSGQEEEEEEEEAEVRHAHTRCILAKPSLATT